ncbi:hypothetical protein IWQ51_005948 [Labrenzia sp. EL_142]|nr:hypothetical protein [Labrenzia sp. EL_142]
MTCMFLLCVLSFVTVWNWRVCFSLRRTHPACVGTVFPGKVLETRNTRVKHEKPNHQTSANTVATRGAKSEKSENGTQTCPDRIARMAIRLVPLAAMVKAAG